MFWIFRLIFMWLSPQHKRQEPDPRWIDVHTQIAIQDIARKSLGITKLS
jgi:hypothetical protein